LSMEVFVVGVVLMVAGLVSHGLVIRGKIVSQWITRGSAILSKIIYC